MYQVFLGQKQASNDYYVMEKKKSKNYNPAASLFSSGINHFSLNVTKYNNNKKKNRCTENCTWKWQQYQYIGQEHWACYSRALFSINGGGGLRLPPGVFSLIRKRI